MKETVEIAAGWTWDELCHLGTELHDPGEDFLSASEWAAHFGKGRRTVDRVLRELEARGMVDKAYRDAYRKDGSVYGIPVYRIHPSRQPAAQTAGSKGGGCQPPNGDVRAD